MHQGRKASAVYILACMYIVQGMVIFFWKVFICLSSRAKAESGDVAMFGFLDAHIYDLTSTTCMKNNIEGQIA